jgi:hypothetical protein
MNRLRFSVVYVIGVGFRKGVEQSTHQNSNFANSFASTDVANEDTFVASQLRK